MSNLKEMSLKRILSFFLAIVLVIGIIELPSAQADGIQSGEAPGATLPITGPSNPNCTGDHGTDNNCPTGYCIDLGFGQCMPLWVARTDTESFINTIAYLYQMNDIRALELTQADGSNITAHQGQYFYLPVVPKGSTQTIAGEERVVSYDITDMTPIIEKGLAAFVGIPNMTSTSNLTTWTGWGGNVYPVKYNGKTITGFKEVYSPYSYTSGERQKATALTPTTLLHYTDENGNVRYCVPRFVYDRNLNSRSFITFTNDTPSSGKTTVYAPSVLEANPWKKNKNISKGPVNWDWVLSESGNSQTMSDLWNRALTMGSNGKQYLDVNKEGLNEWERNKVRGLYATTKMILMAWGDGVSGESFPADGTTYTKTYDKQYDYGIKALIASSKGLSNSEFAPYYPGPLDTNKYSSYSEEYINEYFTALAKLFLKYFSINEYCGVGMTNYGKIMASKLDSNGIHWYNAWNLGKTSDSKNLAIMGGKDMAEDDFYNTALWEPVESYKEDWESMKEEEQRAALQAMSNEEFLNNFTRLNNEALKDESGNYEGTKLKFDYPYVVQSSMILKSTESNEDQKALAQSYHYEIKADYGALQVSQNAYENNLESLKNVNSTHGRIPGFNLELDNNWSTRNFLTYKTFSQAVNNKKENSEGYCTMALDKTILELLSGTAYGGTMTTLKGGRIWPYNVEPWSNYYNLNFASEYGTGEDKFIFGSTQKNSGHAPSSDEKHKVVNVNVYRDIMRTPAEEKMRAGKTNEEPLFLGVFAQINVECNYYQKDYNDERSYMDALISASNKSKDMRWNTLLDANENRDRYDDTALIVYMMEGKDIQPIRNLRLQYITLYDENGQAIKRYGLENNTPAFDNVRLDPEKNYYINYTMLYEILNEVSDKVETKSINTNLETVSGPDGQPQTEYSTDRPQQWNDKESGTYNNQDAATAAKQGRADNRTLTVKELWEQAKAQGQTEISGTWSVEIPPKYNQTDNTYHKDWEKFTLNWKASAQDISPADFDNTITEVFLIDKDGNRLDLSQDCYSPTWLTDIDLGTSTGQDAGFLTARYTLVVKVQRKETGKEHKDIASQSELSFGGVLFGTDYATINPLILKAASSTSQIEKYKEPVSNNNNTLAKNGDYITYYVNGLIPSSGTQICGTFLFQHRDENNNLTYIDKDPENNKRQGGADWGPLDYTVSNLQITPEVINIPQDESYYPSHNSGELNINFSCDVEATYTDKNGNRPIINNDAYMTNFTILLEQKDMTQPNSAFPENTYQGTEVYRINNLRLLINGGATHISGTLKRGQIMDGVTGQQINAGSQVIYYKNYGYRFAARINGGNAISSNSTIHESVKDQKVKLETVHNNNKDFAYLTLKSPPPDSEPLCPTPRTRNDWSQTFSYTHCPQELHDTHTVCSGDPSSCRTYSDCHPQGCYSWTTTANFYETYKLEAYAASQANGWENAPLNNIEIRAGQQFQIRIKSIYYTNRSNMPPPNPYGGCSYLTRSPGYSAPPAYRNLRITIKNPEGGQTWIYNTYYTGWNQEHNSPVFTIPEDTKNLTLQIKVETAPFWGYREGGNQPLCDNANYTVKLTNPLPVSQGTTFIN